MCPKTHEMAHRMVRMLNELWYGAKGVEPFGNACVGGSEACMPAGSAHKRNWRKSREAAAEEE